MLSSQEILEPESWIIANKERQKEIQNTLLTRDTGQGSYGTKTIIYSNKINMNKYLIMYNILL